jgi:UDP-N-acetylglucosamine 2-epimerase (non-hydrolysing)
LVAVLNAVAEDNDLPVVVSTHPRTKKRVDATGAKFHPLVRLMKPLGFHDYVSLQMKAKAVLSDSGTISEESSILNFPALNLREAHERPEGMEEAVAMMVGLEVERVRQGLAILQNQPRGAERALRLVADYSMANVSDKVVRIIHSYTDYVNRVVWKAY